MKKIYFLFLLLANFAFYIAQEQYNTSVYEGNKAFEQEDYDTASAKYLEAIRLNDKDFSAHYNLANSLYKSGKYQDAIAEYKKAEALAKNTDDKTATQYNLGNAYMKNGDRQTATQYYKKALKADPNNQYIRKNYQIAKRQEQQNNDKKQQNPQQKEDKNKNNNNPQNPQKEQKNNGKNPNGQDQSQQGKGIGNSQKQGQNNDEKMPQDLQNALIDRIKNREQETARRILNKNTFSEPQSKEKDW